jgi:hypothetical protein
MNGLADRLLAGPPLEAIVYPPGSRYHGLPTAEITLPDGRVARYLRRRFLPDPAAFVTLIEHRVAEGERLDQLAARYLGDALAAWRIADANGAMRSEALVEEIAQRVRITLPQGASASGASNA